jgi:hypothetical protein
MARKPTTRAERVSRQRIKDQASDPPVRKIEVGSTVLVHTNNPIDGELLHSALVTKVLQAGRLEVEVTLRDGSKTKFPAMSKAHHEANPLELNPWWE